MDGLLDKTKKKAKGLLDVVTTNVAPLQVRTLLGTIAGNQEPITAKTLTQDEINQLDDVIQRTRELRGQTIPEKNIPVFNQGKGFVNYDLMNDAGIVNSDLSLLPSAAIRNTLGQFRYETLPNGNIRVVDRYDFLNDKFPGMSAEQANSARYENLNPFQKIGLLASETWSGDRGMATLPSRFGNAFVGANGRDVNIEFKPSKKLRTKEEIRPSSYDTEEIFRTGYVSPELEKKFGK